MLLAVFMNTIASSVARHQAFQAPLLVYPKLIEERSDGDTKVVGLHGALTLNLRKSSVLAPTLLVRTFRRGSPVENYVNSSVLERHLYEDKEQLAAVNLVQHGVDGISLEGVISPYYRIEPAQQLQRSNEGGIPHLIHLIRERKFKDNVQVRAETRKATSVEGRTAESEESVKLPEKVKVELFVVADKAHYSYFPSRQKFLDYLCTLLLSVNLRFSGMSNPRVRILLIGVELPEEEHYIVGNAKTMYDDLTLPKFQKHAHRMKKAYKKADAVFLLTGRDVYTKEGKKQDYDAAGIAYMGGLCTEYFVGLGEDIPGSYDGVFVFTHELAHILGAGHDGSDPDPESVEGDPGSKNCPWKDGFLMSYEDGGPKHHRFSECSKEQMRHVLSMRGPECWSVTISKAYAPSKVYPGMIVAADFFCKRVYHGKSSVKAQLNDNELARCKMQCCYGRGRDEKCYDHDLLDYMRCGRRKICLRGVCKRQKV
uniref:Peptidase M12B domain-containing protein n=1 Tax=Amblyomma maculatum TaxID=34609 RepID=G3MM67_AMBMU